MSTEKLSRRDWFRLRVPPANRTLGQESVGQLQTTLKAVEHPPNHDGLDLNDLPPMSEAEISPEQVEELFSDIRQLASDIVLMQRLTNGASGGTSTDRGEAQLRIARRALLDGKALRVQVRYRWDGKLWIDTLTRKAELFHLVRICHKEIRGSA